MKKVIPGDYLFCPINHYLIKVMEIYQDKKQDGVQWFAYMVIHGDDNPIGKFHYGSKKHNGWDYKNELLKDWVHIDHRDQLPTLKVLYGKT